MGRAWDKSKWMLGSDWVVVIFSMVRLFSTLWKAPIRIPSGGWWSRYTSVLAHTFGFMTKKFHKQQRQNPPLFSLRFFPFYSFPFFFNIELLPPQSLLTSKKAESAHTSPLAATAERFPWAPRLAQPSRGIMEPHSNPSGQTGGAAGGGNRAGLRGCEQTDGCREERAWEPTRQQEANKRTREDRETAGSQTRHLMC